jgi:TonB family protein
MRIGRVTTRCLTALAVVTLACGAPRTAHADGPPVGVDDAQALTPPRAVNAGLVPYPSGAMGSALILVELVVDSEGRVADVRLVSGEEPFAGAAVEAAWQWRFVPARRGGKDIFARIRMRVDFTPPVIVPSPSPPSATADVTEVTVRGHKPDPGQVTLGGGEVRQLPGAFGDAFRAIEALPGATPMASGLPYFFIRGAPPGDTGYFIDGVRVPLLFHAAFGPSVIHPGLIDHVDYWPGGAPVAFGRFAGGVLSAAAPAPSTVAHGDAIVRVFDAGALVETPFADGRGSALAAGRYSYAGLILSALSPIKVAYWDYQARATWKIDDKNQIGIFAFGSSDDFAQVVNHVTDTILDGGFHRVDLRLDHALDDGSVRVAATLGYGRSNNDNNDIQNLTAAVRASLEDRVSPAMTVRAGGDVTFDRYDLLGNTTDDPLVRATTNVLYPPHFDLAIGGYADAVWQLTPRVQVVPGIRADLFMSHRSDSPASELASIDAPTSAVTTSILPSIDPRLATRVDVDKHVAVISTVGIAHQPAAFLVPVPGLSFVEPNPVLQTAIQMSQGVSVVLPAGFTAQATGFLNTYFDLTDLTATCPSVFGAGVLLGNAPGVMNNLCLTETVRGKAFGGEFLVRRSLGKRLSGWISYTLSRSTRDAPVGLDRVATGVVETLAGFDRTHVINVVTSYDLGVGWQAGARFLAYTGLPYSDTRDYVPVRPYNDERMPAFYRVDLRLEKRWKIAAKGTLALVFEGMNVTLNKEVLGVHCAPGGAGRSTNGLDECTYQTLGPVAVPSVGLEGSL